jgi:hypothetical protein
MSAEPGKRGRLWDAILGQINMRHLQVANGNNEGSDMETADRILAMVVSPSPAGRRVAPAGPEDRGARESRMRVPFNHRAAAADARRSSAPLAAGRVGVAVDESLLADLNEYLDGCPNPEAVWPKWMVKKASRLLWRCRQALAGPLVAGEVEPVAWALVQRNGKILLTTANTEGARDRIEHDYACEGDTVRPLVYADTAKGACLHGADWTASDEAGGWDTRTCNKCGANLGRHRPENPRPIESPQQESRNG